MQGRLIYAITSRSGLGALLLFFVAGVTFLEVNKLQLGTPASMGPGYFPAILGCFFILFGLILLFEAYQKPDERVDLSQFRPIIFLLVGIVLFGLLYPLVGGAVSIIALVVISALAESRRSLRELVLLCSTVVAIVWIIFVWALDLQLNMIPLWVLK